MGMWATVQPDHGARSRRLNLVLALVILGSSAVVEALHGHACTGDGCMLCLASTFAHVLLFAGVGIAIVRPILRILAELRTPRVVVGPVVASRPLLVAASNAARTELTPVTMGVKLLI